MSQTESIELNITNLPCTRVSDGEIGEGNAQQLAPADGGPAAWKFLFGAFVIEALLWGFPTNFGVFQSYYSEHPYFRDEAHNVAVIGTVSTSIYFLGAPIITPLAKRFHAYHRHMVVAGWLFCSISLLAASFTTSVSGLIATQGVAFGTAFTTLYYPVLSMLNEWWVRRRGLGYGVMFGGAGVSGIAYPFVLEALLTRYGYGTTLRAVALAHFLLILPVLPLIKGRLPPASRAATTRHLLDLSFLRQPLFYCFALSNLCQGFAFYIPSIYLPSFSSLLGNSATAGALLLAVYNLASIFGQLAIGWLSDRTDNVLSLVFVSSFVSAVAALTLWGLARSLAMLMVFAFVYGLFAGGWPVLWPKFGSVLAEDPGNVYSLMAFTKGIGSIATGPITASLMTRPAGSGYALGRFEPVIIFLGSFMFCSSLGILGWPLKRRHAHSA